MASLPGVKTTSARPVAAIAAAGTAPSAAAGSWSGA